MTITREARKIKVKSFMPVIPQAIGSRTKKQKRTDDGSMLVEVLVALLVLAIVFTSAVLALSDMASKRVAIEQRDRAIRLITEYEELSRILRCGLIVDKDIENPSLFANQVADCDFDETTTNNAGDQEFTVQEITGAGEQEFVISIRYWWEVAGSDIHTRECVDIQGAINTPDEGLSPTILARAIHIEWREKGQPVTETLIKRDPIPVDSPIFASGNRGSILVPITPGATYRYAMTAGASSPAIQRITDFDRISFPGQPQECIWLPYIAADNTPRIIDNAPVPAPVVPGKV